MSASGDGTRGSPKSKGKTLRSFFGSLPGFSSAWNPVSHTNSSTKDVQTAVDRSGTPAPPSPVATNPQMARDASGLLQLSEQTAGDKNMGSIGATSSQDAFYSGVAGIMDAAKGKVQGSLSATQLALVGTKETVSGGVMGAVDMAKGLVKGGLDTSKSVLMGTKDTVTTGLTGAMNVAKGTVQTGLDTSKSVLMGTKDTVTTGLTGAMNVAKGTVQTGLDTSKSVLMGTKDTVTTGLTGAVNVAKGTVQTGLDTSKSVLMGTKDTVTTGLTGAMNVAKGTVQTGLDTSKSVLMGTKDTVTTGLTGAVNLVKGVAQGGLDTSKSVLMGPKDSVCAGAPGAINVVKGAAQGGLDTSNSAFTGTKSAMLAGFAGAMDMARGTAQTGLHPSKHIHTGTEDMVCAGVTSIMDTAKDSQKNTDTTRDRLSTMLAHSAIRSVEECGHPAATDFAALPDELKGLGDIFQPMTAEEQAQLAASESGSRVLSANRRSYYICLGDLAPSFRQRAFEHALSHIQHNQFQARAALAQLQEAFQMIPTEFGKDRDIVGCKVADSWGKSMMQASVAQNRLCTLVHQLHAAYSSLATSLQGLPEVQQQAGQARHSLCKLYGLVTSEAGSELQTEQLAQSSAGVVQAWQGLEVLLDKLQQNPPLDWLVGPFTLMPCGQLQAPEGWAGRVPRDHAMTTDDCTSPKLWIEQEQRVLRK